ncbi:DNA-binding transcriptional LysR family regulator [Natronospira proteinivora]|uniref:DNA-binding transcriptional LysR family regulator n=1 Tax=Natronospira proteinivora TaxID=1807133 RepID=A0ABT1G6Z8_9GAMM|nr:LysR family transcriptional regulator [Natronospira proteinivora]MCP1727021.1 DNA-binding transcriptional LysR family regulator [Natronospira proteinivora]
MGASPKTTLAQWRSLQAVVDEGGYAQAAEVLNRSQSSISYAVARLEESLGVSLLRLEGRRARLTEAGALLLRGARNLLAEAEQLEGFAATLAEGWEAELALAVDAICPRPLIMNALATFAREASGTRVALFEEVLSGAGEALEAGSVDLALTPTAPAGFLGEPLMDVAFLPVAHPDHPLARAGRALTGDALSRELQVVIRDSARRDRRDSGWLASPRRWTVGSLETAQSVVMSGTGFAWLPAHQVEAAVTSGALSVLSLVDGGGKRSHLYLVKNRGQAMGPAVRLLADCIRAAARNWHQGANERPGHELDGH